MNIIRGLSLTTWFEFNFLRRCIRRLFRGDQHHSVCDAEYNNGLVITGIDGIVKEVQWCRLVAERYHCPSNRCPLIVYLDDGVELDDSTFQSPDAMRALGAKMAQGPKTDKGQNMSFAEFRTRDYFVATSYADDVLDVVELHVLKDATGTLRVSVDGRTFELPISQESLFEILGPPAVVE